jgi:glucosylceramidase
MYHWVTGWVEWNLALDMYGHPNWANMMSNAPVHINATAKEYYKNPTFYILGHYTKFIAPDSVRVSITSTNTGLSLDNFNFVAFDRPDNSTVVIVYNFSDKPIDLVINDQSNGNIVTKIGEHSIQTYVYWN